MPCTECGPVDQREKFVQGTRLTNTALTARAADHAVKLVKAGTI